MLFHGLPKNKNKNKDKTALVTELPVKLQKLY